MLVITLGVAFILLLRATLFYEKYRRGISLNREERFLAWAELTGLIILILLTIFTPDFLITNKLYLLWVLVAAVIVTYVTIMSMTLHHYQHKIEQIFERRSYRKLVQRIRRELENEATAKKLTFPYQTREDVLSKLADSLAFNNINVATPITYSVIHNYSALPNGDVCAYLGGHMLAVPASTADALAVKMNLLSNDTRYRWTTDSWEKSLHGDGDVSYRKDKIILSIKKEGANYVMLYRKAQNSLWRPTFRMRASITPLIPYRFALGIWTSENPRSLRSRLAILEVDDDAFKLVNTMANSTCSVQEFNVPLPRKNQTYRIELEMHESPYIAVGRVYRENELLGEVRADNLGLPYLSDVFFGIAVWTDDSSSPLSKYAIRRFEVV